MKKVRYEYSYTDENFMKETLVLRETEAKALYEQLKADFDNYGGDW